ncbi:hypothetical protein [Acidianus brierleyi]|uniref:Flagellar protein FlgN n=1 Tax=Acidianus brierleyi TaxID=41673 RepID=A0A2U9IF76_9CREN|nr:hypothetical protein [Acidianus brierleyi]AWR94625.1 hypothetical protein DFR85_08500 [Acidianus brierleyi]
MIAKTRMENLYREIEGLQQINLSLAEQGILSFLKEQARKEEDLILEFEKNISEKKWDESLISFFQLGQRTNLIFSYLVQPAVISSLSSSKIAEIAQDLVDCLSTTIAEAVISLKNNMKNIGIESITSSLNSNPPSINISLVLKSA